MNLLDVPSWPMLLFPGLLFLLLFVAVGAIIAAIIIAVRRKKRKDEVGPWGKDEGKKG